MSRERSLRHVAASWPLRIAALTVLACIIVFYGLGSNSLHDYDEAKHALVAKKIADDGEWLTLREPDGSFYFDKAPLKLWMTAALFEVAGVSELTIRFWSAAFAVATVLAIALLGAELIGKRAALLAALILLANTQFLYNHSAKTGEMDAALLFFMTAGLLLLPRAGTSRRAFLASCACIALCGMVKHASYAALAAGIGGIYLLASGTWRKIGVRTALLGVLVFLVVLLPWHLHQWIVHGAAFTRVYFGEQLGQRMQGELFGGHESPGAAFYLPVLFYGLFPWTILAGAAVLRGARRAIEDRARVELLLLIWAIVTVAAATSSGNKFSWYVLPCYPALALLTGSYLAALFEKHRSRLLHASFVLGFAGAWLFASTAASENPFAHRAADGLIEAHPRAWLASAWDSHGAIVLAIGITSAAALVLLWDRALLATRLARLTRGITGLAVAALMAVAFHAACVPLRHADHETCVDHLVASAAASHDFLLLAERADAGVFYGWARVGPTATAWRKEEFLQAIERLPAGGRLQLILPVEFAKPFSTMARYPGPFRLVESCGDYALMVQAGTAPRDRPAATRAQ